MNLKINSCWLMLFAALIYNPIFASDPPGVVISAATDFKKDIVACPSIAILPDGTYVASHNWSTDKNSTLIFTSSNRGRSWKKTSEIHQIRSTLFVHRNDLYMMGINKRFGVAAISKSTDNGKTWTSATDENNGLLDLKGSYYTQPVPILIHNGRVWRGYEEFQSGKWLPMVFSAPSDSDLLRASNWTKSNSVQHSTSYFGGPKDLILEGNVLNAPDGSYVNFLRASGRGSHAAILPISKSGSQLEFDPPSNIIEFPFNESKFTIRFDDKTKRYWTIGNKTKNPFATANVLVLGSSADLRNWQVDTVIQQHVDGTNHAFKSTDWQFDGDDLVAVCSTAWDKSSDHKHPNYLTFHRVENFREATMSGSAKLLGSVKNNKFPFKNFQISGINFTMEKFVDGEEIFSNRSFKLHNIPNEFQQGWQFTRIQGGNRANLSINVLKNTEVYFATNIVSQKIDISGWESVPSSSFNYGNGKNLMRIYKRSVQVGQTIKVPEGNWSGGIVIAPTR